MKKMLFIAIFLLHLNFTYSQVIRLSYAQKKEILEKHNFYRKQFENNNLIWSEELESEAISWLKYIDKNPLLNINTYNYEQNMAFLIDTNINKAVFNWIREQVFYSSLDDSAQLYLYQHFYRMINPNLKKIGCAFLEKDIKYYVLLCFYSK